MNDNDHDYLSEQHYLLRALTVELMRAAQLTLEHNCKEENENWNEPCPVAERLRAAIRLTKEMLQCS